MHSRSLFGLLFIQKVVTLFRSVCSAVFPDVLTAIASSCREMNQGRTSVVVRVPSLPAPVAFRSVLVFAFCSGSANRTLLLRAADRSGNRLRQAKRENRKTILP